MVAFNVVVGLGRVVIVLVELGLVEQRCAAVLAVINEGRSRATNPGRAHHDGVAR